MVDRLRARHSPPQRNYPSPHVTLFHALPGEHIDVAGPTSTPQRPAFDVAVSGLRFSGRGVADIGVGLLSSPRLSSSGPARGPRRSCSL